VPIVADLVSPLPDGLPLHISGQIDRLAQTRDGVLIIDFKSHRSPPLTVGAVSVAYLLQLAAYRLALQHIFPGQAVRAALIWTAGPTLMEIPATVLDNQQERLWKLKNSNLDVSGATPTSK